MKSATELMPELSAWNNGKGIRPLDYVFAEATSAMSVALVDLLWPEFTVFESYVLRGGFILDTVRTSERAGWTRSQIEAAANYLDLGGLFRAESDSSLLNERINFIGKSLVETYRAKLAKDFPDRAFSVALYDDEEDFYLTFFQVLRDV